MILVLSSINTKQYNSGTFSTLKYLVCFIPNILVYHLKEIHDYLFHTHLSNIIWNTIFRPFDRGEGGFAFLVNSVGLRG